MGNIISSKYYKIFELLDVRAQNSKIRKMKMRLPPKIAEKVMPWGWGYLIFLKMGTKLVDFVPRAGDPLPTLVIYIEI